MKLLNYVRNGQIRAGAIEGDDIFDVGDGAINLQTVTSVDDIISRGLLDEVKSSYQEITSGKSRSVKINNSKVVSPVLLPEKIYLAAVNYLSHSVEQTTKPPPYPYFFTKFRNALIGPDEPVILPKVSHKVDWEVELAIIIGRQGKNIPKKDAMSYVAGYSIANDISFRDFQMNEMVSSKPPNLERNWVKGKGMDSSFPVGPYLVTTDEIQNPYDRRMTLWVNGEKRQDSTPGEMVYKIDELIEYLSAGTTLKPGDVISTGTPMGVAYFSGAPFLKAGDVIEAKIDGLGILRNPVESET